MASVMGGNSHSVGLVQATESLLDWVHVWISALKYLPLVSYLFFTLIRPCANSMYKSKDYTIS